MNFTTANIKKNCNYSFILRIHELPVDITVKPLFLCQYFLTLKSSKIV